MYSAKTLEYDGIMGAHSCFCRQRLMRGAATLLWLPPPPGPPPCRVAEQVGQARRDAPAARVVFSSSQHAIDCSASNEHYTGDAHFASRVVDSGHCN